MTASVVQQVTGGVTQDYGIGTTNISTAAGNGIVVFAGWNVAGDASLAGPNVAMPAVNVTDSTGTNVWRQIGLTDSSPAYGVRCAIWMCANAQSVDWVSVSLTGFAGATAWTVVEISGLPQAVSVDFTAVTAGYGASFSPLGTTAAADIAFSMGAAGSSVTVAAPPPGFTALTGSSAGISPAVANPVKVFPYWETGISAGTNVNAGISLSGNSPFAGVLCCIQSAATAPAQPNANFPLVITEAAWGATPGDISSSTDYTWSPEYVNWTDISTRVIGPAVAGRMSGSRGRQYELQEEEAGEFNPWLSNVDGAFTPGNTGSPFYSNAINSNMSFEAGVQDWSPGAGVSLVQSSAWAYSGLYSAKVTPSSGVSTIATATHYPVNVNYPYTASAWLYCPGGWSSGGRAQIRWFNASGTHLSDSTGGSVALPAGTAVQVTLTATPPATAAFAQLEVSLAGSPASSNVYYADEAALVTGSDPVSTGLVALVTPIRVTAWWNSRQYAIWQGYAERWPQMWPELPQYGFSKMTATDAIAVAAAGQMQSALIGDVLVDNPYAYLPCNEQYTTTTTGITPAQNFFLTGGYQVPVDASGLIAINRATGNQVTGTYADGLGQQVTTGVAINFLGDNGTAMGATGFQAQGLGDRGPGMFYTDPGLPGIAAGAGGFTIEFWFMWNPDAASDIQSIALLTGYGPPSAFWVPALTPASNGSSIIVYVYYGTTLSVTVNNTALFTDLNLAQTSSPQHCVLVFGPSGSPTVTFYVNGESQGSTAYSPPAAMNALGLGPGRYSYDCNNQPFYYAFNYASGHLAIYSYQLTAQRIQSHYETGANGWQGTTAAYRAAQILTWAGLGLKRGGYYWGSATGNAEITQIGPAYDLSGSSASDAVNAVAQSEGGQYFVQANGSLVYLERWAAYNESSQATLGDGNGEIPYLQDMTDDYDNTYLYSEVVATQQDGPNQLIVFDNRDTASQEAYFRRSALTFTSDTVSPYDVSDVTTWSLAQFAQPSLHIATITVDAASNPSVAFPAVLELDLGDIVTVNRRPVGGAVLSELGIIERISFDIGPGYFRVSYQISPYTPSNSVLEASVSGFDTPATTTLGWLSCAPPLKVGILPVTSAGAALATPLWRDIGVLFAEFMPVHAVGYRHWRRLRDAPTTLPEPSPVRPRARAAVP